MKLPAFIGKADPVLPQGVMDAPIVAAELAVNLLWRQFGVSEARIGCKKHHLRFGGVMHRKVRRW